MFPILSSWEEIQSSIIDKYIRRRRGGSSTTLDARSRKHLYAEINSKLQNPLYQDLDNEAIISTLRYIYWETRAGIFVSIRNNKLEAFLPFANARYRNDWSSELSFVGVDSSSKHPVRDYLEYKSMVLSNGKNKRSRGNVMLNPSNWWANHHFLNMSPRPDVWGQHSLQEYHDMIHGCVSSRVVGNVMFVINKRDHPVLRLDLRKPYTFLYRGRAPLVSHPKSKYAPILTSYSNPEYLDITIPIVQDWTIATNPENYYPITTDIAWNDKQEIAFFRGAATGRLLVRNNKVHNQRIMLAELSTKWEQDKPNLLDAGITSWNLSDKIDSNGVVRFIVPSEMEARGVSLKAKIPMNEQVCYKYLINMDGHTAPNRTSWILSSGCLMLLVESLFNDTTWIDRNLKAWVHYVPVKADLSDLEEQIIWCKKNDDECKKIVRNAKVFARTYFNKETICDYMAYLLNRIHANKH